MIYPMSNYQLSSSELNAGPGGSFDYLGVIGKNHRYRAQSAPSNLPMNSYQYSDDTGLYGNSASFGGGDNPRMFGLHGGPPPSSGSFRQGDAPMSISHKRVMDDHNSWKNETPISVTARLFRGNGTTGQSDHLGVSSEVNKSSMPMYRPQLAMNHYGGGMDQVMSTSKYGIHKLFTHNYSSSIHYRVVYLHQCMEILLLNLLVRMIHNLNFSI
jgi:hypothetical protein